MVSGFISWTGAPPPPPRSCSSTGSRATPAPGTTRRARPPPATASWHSTPAANGGLVWKYDRAIRDAVRSGQWRDPVDLWPLWSAITCPTLIVRGAESDVLAPETAKRMLATNPHARLVDVPGAGHTVPGEQPAAFQRLLTEFLGA